MNNAELDKLLKNARIPEPSPEFWEELPGRVQRGRLRANEVNPTRVNLFEALFRWLAPLSIGAACAVLGFFWGAHSRTDGVVPSSELAEARACWREASALFPNQLLSIVFDQAGSRVVLSEKPDEPVAAPIYLKLCDGENCQRFITFSGQQIKVNGARFEVLIDRQGDVLLVGDAQVWDSEGKNESMGAYKIFAQVLGKS